MSEAAQPAGIEVGAVEAWIAEHAPPLKPPFAWTRLRGGHSNLTYRIQDASGVQAVVRRPPLGKLLPKAHDMGREFKIISALSPIGVPVAPPLGFCEDPEVTGAPFYVMGYVEGEPLHIANDADRIPRENRIAVSYSFVDILAELHSFEPEAIGLGDLGRPDAYVARQLKRWYGSWNASRDAAGIDLPVVDELHDYLVSHLPDQEPGKVVHGDYGLHNCLVLPEGRISCVLDWEISTLGDPLADLGYAMNSWTEPGEPMPPKANAVTDAPGFITRDGMLERYAEKSGRDVSQISYYRAFNFWKTTCIIQGVYARYQLGQKSTQGIDLEYLYKGIHRAAKLSSKLVESL